MWNSYRTNYGIKITFPDCLTSNDNSLRHAIKQKTSQLIKHMKIIEYEVHLIKECTYQFLHVIYSGCYWLLLDAVQWYLEEAGGFRKL